MVNNQINITVFFKNENIRMVVDIKTTLESLKKQVSDLVNLPLNELVLYFKDRFLTEDTKTIEELKIHENDVIFLKKRNLKVEPGQKSDMTKDLLKNPMVKTMLKDPQMMKNMLKSLPGYEKEMKKNNELKKMLNNRQAIEEFEKIVDNPDYYDQQLRNVDLAMSKLENLPGGFNMMTSINRDFRDPFTNMLSSHSLPLKVDGSFSKDPTNLPNIWGNNKKKNPLIKYRLEIKEIMNLGFTDINSVADALSSTNGDIDAALEILYEKQHRDINMS